MSVFVPNYITIDGETLDVVDNSIKLEGFEGWEREAVLGATGRDDTKSKRVERKITVEVKITRDLAMNSLWVCDAQIVVGQTPDCGDGKARRVRCNPCDTMSVGEIGEGTLEIAYLVKAPVEWL